MTDQEKIDALFMAITPSERARLIELARAMRGDDLPANSDPAIPIVLAPPAVVRRKPKGA